MHRDDISGAVRVDRRTKWGNPFRVGYHSREAAIEHFRAYLRQHPELVAAARVELAGRDLACWCAPKACHGDVLLRVAQGGEP